MRTEIKGLYIRGFNPSAVCNISHNCCLSFSVAIRSGVTSPLERCSSQLTRLMIPIRLVIAIDVKRANIPVYWRLPLSLLDASMPQPVNTFCLVPTSPPV